MCIRFHFVEFLIRYDVVGIDLYTQTYVYTYNRFI